MRLLKFLSEQEEFEGCSKSINFYKNHSDRLFRGMKNAQNEGKIITPTNRFPRDSSLWFHQNINKAFNTVFGKPLRSCSVFCTGDLKEAKDYGNVYEIYPSDDFEVYWSNDIKDIYTMCPIICGYSTKDQLALNSIWAIAINAVMGKTSFEVCLGSRNMKSHEKQAVLDFLRSEFSRPMAKAYKVDNNSVWIDFAENILEKYPNCMVNFVRSNYRKGNLEAAIKSHNEIMVTCSFYYYKKSLGN